LENVRERSFFWTQEKGRRTVLPILDIASTVLTDGQFLLFAGAAGCHFWF